MKWNSEEGYIQYKMALSDIMTRLGISAVDYHVRPELAPYITKILQYLDRRLIELGDEADMLEKLQEVFDTFDYGADLIVDLNGLSLAKEVGVYNQEDEESVEALDDSDDTLSDSTETDEPDDFVPYYQDRFIFSWTNVMSCLVTRLKLMYSSLLVEPVSQLCPCCCGSEGETFKDWESWSGKIYPEDEEYDTSNYNLGTTQNYGVVKSSSCTCGYRL